MSDSTEPVFDLGRMAAPSLALRLRNGLTVHGLRAEIYDVVIFDNDFAVEFPEFEDETEPIDTCKVLIGKPVEGIVVADDFISLSDKLEQQQVITTYKVLQPNQIIRVLFRDGKRIRFRIIGPGRTLHQATQNAYEYDSMVV